MSYLEAFEDKLFALKAFLVLLLNDLVEYSADIPMNL